MSKKVIGMIVAAVLLIAVVVSIVAIKVSKVDTEEGKNVEETALSLEDLNKKMAKMAPFDEMATMDVDSTMLTDVFLIDEDKLEGFVGKFPMMMVHASMYLVVEAKDGEVEDVKEQVETYAEGYEEQWAMYLPEQYELVKDRKCGVSGNFVYLFVGESADEMEKLMK